MLSFIYIKKHHNEFNKAFCVLFKNRAIDKNNAKQITPIMPKAVLTPEIWAKEPAKMLPNGAVPAKVSTYILITLPRYSSGTIVCIMEFMMADEVKIEKPINTKIAAQIINELDKDNKIKLNERVNKARIKKCIFLDEFFKLASKSPANIDPIPLKDISNPKPLACKPRISLANAGSKII
jgi:hypothetical protein